MSVNCFKIPRIILWIRFLVYCRRDKMIVGAAIDTRMWNSTTLWLQSFKFHGSTRKSKESHAREIYIYIPYRQLVPQHSRIKLSFRWFRNKLTDVQWNRRDSVFVLRDRRDPMDSVKLVVKKREREREREAKEERKRKLSRAVSNLARTFSIPKGKGLGPRLTGGRRKLTESF